MSYSSPFQQFPTNLIVAQQAIWYSAEQLNDLILRISTVYFPIVESRSTGFDSLTAIFPPPFALNVRFPAASAYVSTLDPVLSRILSQLSSSLSYKDRLIEKTAFSSNAPITSNTPLYVASFNSFTSAKLALVNYFADVNNYLYRAKFELNFQLTWS